MVIGMLQIRPRVLLTPSLEQHVLKVELPAKKAGTLLIILYDANVAGAR